MKPVVRLVSILCICMLFLLSVCVGWAEPRSFTPQEARSSVFRVVVYDQSGKPALTGSSFLVAFGEDRSAYLLTNAHVVPPNTKDVRLFISEDNEIPCSVVNVYENLDLSVLKVTQSLSNAQPLPFGKSSRTKVGDDVFALGFPQVEISDHVTGSSEDVVVTKGIISKKTTWNGIKYYQTDASVNNGNSGGPLLHKDGFVIGINTMKLQGAESVAGAVMVDEILPYLDGIPYELSVQGRMSRILRILFILVIVALVLLALFFAFMAVLYFANRKLFRAIASSLPLLLGLTREEEKEENVFRYSVPCLTGVSGAYAGAVFPLSSEHLIIGRDTAQCAVVYPENMAQISRVHCALSYDKESNSFKLEDFSRNGTYLENGVRIQPGDPAKITDGTRFYLSEKREMFAVRLVSQDELEEETQGER